MTALERIERDRKALDAVRKYVTSLCVSPKRPDSSWVEEEVDVLAIAIRAHKYIERMENGG